MIAAIGWGALAASSLVIGAALGILRDWPKALVGAILAFGAGALVSAVAFELALEGIHEGGAPAVGIGVAVGALVYFGADSLLDRGGGDDGGVGLALGAFLDGIPEQLVLGIGLASGSGIGVGLLAAIFVSNLPEGIGSATEMKAKLSDRRIMLIWVAVALVCTGATVLGYAMGDATGGHLRAAINGFAAGALLVMLVDSMIPEAHAKTGRAAGLVTVLGFSVAVALSLTS
jgi:ZIP family zinc transporter